MGRPVVPAEAGTQGRETSKAVVLDPGLRRDDKIKGWGDAFQAELTKRANVG